MPKKYDLAIEDYSQTILLESKQTPNNLKEGSIEVGKTGYFFSQQVKFSGNKDDQSIVEAYMKRGTVSRRNLNG